jgi:hypothetical protein
MERLETEMSSWSPHDINVMLHHYCVKSKWPYGATDAYKASLEHLHHYGLIDRADEFSAPTDKGRAFIELILNTPVPVAKFVDPRFES